MNLDFASCGFIAEVDWSSMVPIGFLVLIPLIPAVILYKLFEQKTLVSGPFQGLRLDLSGAFAGYFLLLIVCSGLLFGPLNPDYKKQIAELRMQLKETSDLGTAWTVSGKVALKRQDGSSDRQLDGVGIAIYPVPKIAPDGSFDIRVLKDKSGAVARFPALELSKSGYFPAVVHLEPLGKKLGKEYEKTIDKTNRLLTIDEVVELTADPTGKQNAATTGP